MVEVDAAEHTVHESFELSLDSKTSMRKRTELQYKFSGMKVKDVYTFLQATYSENVHLKNS